MVLVRENGSVPPMALRWYLGRLPADVCPRV